LSQTIGLQTYTYNHIIQLLEKKELEEAAVLAAHAPKVS
jgi:hypothetical protein